MRTIISILICSLAFSLNAANYEVIKTKGTVKDCKTGLTLFQGDKFTDINLVCLENRGDTIAEVALLNLENGVSYLLKEAKNESREKENVLEAMVLPILMRNGSPPPKDLKQEIKDLRSYFSSGEKTIFGGEWSLRLFHFSTAPSGHFRVQYLYKRNRIVKILRHTPKNLTIRAIDIFVVDGVPISQDEVSEIRLEFYDRKLKESTFIGRFKVHFLFNHDIEKEMAVILKAPQNRIGAGENFGVGKKMQDYLKLFYKNTDRNNVYGWVQTYINKRKRRGTPNPGSRKRREEMSRERMKAMQKRRNNRN